MKLKLKKINIKLKIQKISFTLISLLYLIFSLLLDHSNLQAYITECSSLVSSSLFTNIDMISPSNKDNFLYSKKTNPQISSFCEKLNTSFQKYNWFTDPCSDITWRAEQKTKLNHPLIFTEFGTGSRSMLIFSGVHPDELVAIPIGFMLAKHLKQNPQIYTGKNIKIVIAPLLNPDGFFLDKPTRANSNGVDLNRNFFTKDWYQSAKKSWQSRPGRQRDRRVFPGYFPNSEVETLFQIRLINQFVPNKILSMHAPLGFLDYDGPGKKIASTPREKKAKNLVYSISEKSGNYRVVQYTYYPGSLGNYAGNERAIPTVTLEFDTEDPNKFKNYWKTFLPGLMNYITYDIDQVGSDVKSLLLSSYID